MKRSRKRRRYTAVAALLAVALAVPVGVHLTSDPAPAPAPHTEAKAPDDGPLTADKAMREARRTGKDVEVTARHTANSTTWAQPDGLLRTRTYSDTIRAMAGGEWKPVDTTLQRVDGGYAPKAVNGTLLFSAGTQPTSPTRASRASRAVVRAALTTGPSDDAGTWSRLVRLTIAGHDIDVSWPGPLPAPVVDGPRALYEEVRPGIDLLMTARDGGYSHVLIVKNRDAAHDPVLARLPYRMTSPSLTFVLDPKSKALSARDSAGEEIAAAPTPYMWDSAGTVRATVGEPAASPAPAVRDTSLALPGLAGPQPGTHDAVLDASLSQDSGTLDVAVDQKLLTDADTVYPVFIDPSFKGRKLNWTVLYKKHSTASFWNGQNFNDGADEARVGYESDSGGLSRSVFTFEYGSALHGKKVKSAVFRGLQTYSWGCESRQYNLYLTGPISSSSTWNNQPAWIKSLGSQTNGHGYNTTDCPDKWVAMDIRSAAQEASTNKWSTMTLGLRAANESDTNAWKKFLANGENAPYIEVVYNAPPNEPVALNMKTSPGTTCDTTSPYPGIGKQDITITVTGSDPDGVANLKYINVYAYPADNPAAPVINQNLTPDTSGKATSQLYPWSMFTSGKTYIWTARTIDHDGEMSAWGPAGTTAQCRFTVDHSAPSSPTVESTAFPPADLDGAVWSAEAFGATGTFSFSVPGATDIARYEYSFNTAFNMSKAAGTTTGGQAVTDALKPPHAGPNALFVRAVDKTGNYSPVSKYLFNVKPAPVMDSPMDVTGDAVPDVYTITPDGELRFYAKPPGIDRLHHWIPAAYTTEQGEPAVVASGYWSGALITHNGDWLPGDGIQDLVARMPDGKLYVYPGDGYSGFDVSRRVEVLLPSGAPAPGSLRQILAVGDVTGDGRPDLLALAGGDLWAFTGYTGVSFAKATKLSGEDWTDRDLVQVGHIAGDTAPDLVYRVNASGQLHLRYGRNAASGGLDFGSLATKTASAGQLDTYGGSTVRTRAAAPVVTGTPDVTGDGLPEVWTMYANGDVYVHPGNATGLVHAGSFWVIKETLGTTWAGHTAIG
ncbi:DNRLRE domain-containing protein [Streptomyces sp. TRM64462]|uniref:DNRLRE domain-containing protein n=1 Tax=Streptomyces sp. TRM64462 TaxID=2741726 RepID=UPI0015864508|nr:DNRLRE domain-containing protein [Streptomyces sp. TRM64462]